MVQGLRARGGPARGNILTESEWIGYRGGAREGPHRSVNGGTGPAVWVILNGLVWPEVDVSPEDEVAIEEGLGDLGAGRRVGAEDVWHEPGI